MKSSQAELPPFDMLARLGRLLACLVLAMGASVLLGWASAVDCLKNFFPDEAPVAISTGLCLVLTAAAALLTQRKMLARVCSLVALGISLTILLHYLAGTFDLDVFFHGQRMPVLGPDRMSPSILFCFLALNLALMLDPKRYFVCIDFLVLFSGALCLTAFASHFYDLPSLLQTRTIIQMASTAALAGLLLCGSVLLVHPGDGIVAVLCSKGTGGRFARHYLIPAIVVPFVVGRLALNGVLNHLYDSSLGTALVVIFTVSCLVSILFRVSMWLNDADSARDRAQEDMRSSVENTRLIVDAATDAFMLVDSKGRVVDWNPAAEQLLGWSKEEILGRSFEFALAVEDRRMHLDNFEEYIRTGVSEQLNQVMELKMLHRNGAEVTAEGAPFAVRSRSEERVGLFFHDISDRKESERRINEFISTVSHELRTPLTSIKGALRLIEGGLAGDVSAESMTLINVATSETERLIRIVNDILDLKKIEAGKLELNFADVQLGLLVEEALEGISGMATDFGIELRKEVSASGYLHCDKDRIIQVLHNLLSNAIKFSPEGEAVRLLLEKTKEVELRFSVFDRGCGIPENQVHKLFGRFQQLDSSDSRQQGGTGLGLAISKAIVEQHQGRIGFESHYGQGSTFWFEIPFAEQAERIAAEQEADAVPPAHSNTGAV